MEESVECVLGIEDIEGDGIPYQEGDKETEVLPSWLAEERRGLDCTDDNMVKTENSFHHLELASGRQEMWA